MRRSLSYSRLHDRVRLLAATIGLVIAFVVPLTFLSVSYLEEARHLEVEAGRIAGRLSRFIYVQGPSWRFGVHQLSELLALDAAPDDPIRQLVIDDPRAAGLRRRRRGGGADHGSPRARHRRR